MFQIFDDYNFTFHITKFDFLYRLYENNYNILFFLQIDNSLNFLT